MSDSQNRPRSKRANYDDIESEYVQLPSILPVFPLSGAVLLPGCHLPLNIFEPRYLTMVRHAMEGDGFIGIIQPQDVRDDDDKPALFSVGGAGKIGNMRETSDGRILIELRGVSRFTVARELDATTPYRQIVPNWDRFPDDQQMMIEAHDMSSDLDDLDGAFAMREPLLASLKRYLDQKGIGANYEIIAQAPDAMLVNGLCMIVPLHNAEKQALLEARDMTDRASKLISLFDMACFDNHDMMTDEMN